MNTHRSTRRSATLFAVLLALGLAGCERAPETEDPVVDRLDMRGVMYEIQYAVWDVEPHLRNPEKFPEIAEHLATVSAWVEDSTWEDWLTENAYEDEVERLFRKFRNQLRVSAKDAHEGAAADDLNALRDGFTRMSMSCVACHKRFQANY